MIAYLVRLVALVLVTFATPQAAHADDTDRWERDTICVARHNDHDWGVWRAVRQWNAVDAGQPRLVLRDSCPFWGSIHVRDSYRPYWEYAGLTSPLLHDGVRDRVVIEMNDQIRQRSRLNADQWRAWKYYATLHEFGHALGLHHSAVVGSVMCYCTNWIAGGRVDGSDRYRLRLLY